MPGRSEVACTMLQAVCIGRPQASHGPSSASLTARTARLGVHCDTGPVGTDGS
jgi:hypothetical protein